MIRYDPSLVAKVVMIGNSTYYGYPAEGKDDFKSDNGHRG